jgi:hypothetical protein
MSSEHHETQQEIKIHPGLLGYARTMRIQRVSYGIRGFQRITDDAVSWLRMVTDEAKKRARILAFWKTYGLEAAREAFSVSRSTLFAWQKAQKEHGSLEALNPQSRKPKKVRAYLKNNFRGQKPDFSSPCSEGRGGISGYFEES